MLKKKRTLTRVEKIERHTTKAVKSGKLSTGNLEKLLSKEREAQREEVLETLLKEETKWTPA